MCTTCLKLVGAEMSDLSILRGARRDEVEEPLLPLIVVMGTLNAGAIVEAGTSGGREEGK